MADTANGAQAPLGVSPSLEERALLLEAAKLQLQILSNPGSLMNLGYQIALADNPADFVPAAAVKLASQAREIRRQQQSQVVGASFAELPPPPGGAH